jgi:hypothetical protein
MLGFHAQGQWTALIFAAEYDSVECVQALLEAGADAEARDEVCFLHPTGFCRCIVFQYTCTQDNSVNIALFPMHHNVIDFSLSTFARRACMQLRGVTLAVCACLGSRLLLLMKPLVISMCDI